MSIAAMKAIQMVYANTTKHDWPDDIWEAICQAIEAEKQSDSVEPVGVVGMDVIVVNLVREGINKHRARELAEHFIKHTHPQPKREPVALRSEQFVDMARAIAPRTVMGMKEQIPNWIVEFGRAVEAAHGIKENT